MKFLDLLRKLGIYRSGIVTWSGEASKRKVEFIQNDVFNSEKDNLNKEDLKPGGLVSKVIWWFYVVFAVLFILGSISFSFGFLVTTAIWIYLIRYVKSYSYSGKYPTIKIIAVLIVGIFISLILADTGKTYNIKIKNGTDDPKVVLNYQNAIVKLVLDYKVAQIDTSAITSIKFGSMSLDEYQAFLKKTETEWQTVASDADALANFLQYAPAKKVSLIEKGFSLIKTAFAQTSQPGDITSDFKNGGASEVGIQQQITDWDRVDVYRQVLPDKNILKATQVIFKTTAQNAKVALETHGTQMAKIFTSEAEFYKACSNTARTIGTGAKVTLYVAGALTTGGAATVAAEAMQATTVVVGGVDAALDVGETTAIVALGNEDTPPIIQKAKDKLYWVSTLLAIKDLKLNLSAADAAGNISTIGGLVNDGVNTVLDMKGDTVQVKTKRTVSVISRDTLIENVYPKDLLYETKFYDELAKEQVKNNKLDPEYKAAMEKLEADRLKILDDQKKKEIDAALEQARKDQAIQKIIDQKEKERAEKALNPVTTPTPVVPTPVNTPVTPAGSVVNSCSLCAQSGLDCACGRESCRCCAPNDSSCNAFDL